MTPDNLKMLAPIIAILVALLVAIPFFLKGYRAAKERQKREKEQNDDGAV